MDRNLKIIVSGGGTGGHIFPALSIADAVRALVPDAEILFVGAEGKMEMERVPVAGYRIVGLPVAGLDRRNWLKNVIVLWKLWKSQRMARCILKDFGPNVVVGVGGYASGPTLKMAQRMGIPTLIQEQNSYAGVTNKLLAKGAQCICVAYDGMERFFPADRIVKTGNPVRSQLLACRLTPAECRKRLGLDIGKRTILIVGGSLGARTVNESVLQHMDDIRKMADKVQVVWQTGKFYSEEIRKRLAAMGSVGNLLVTDFVSEMDVAYRASDLVISRAGASSISELCLLRKPCILVPSPNVAEDHQTKNAMALSTKGAALLVRDGEAREDLIPLALRTVLDDEKLSSLAENAGLLAEERSAERIAEEIVKMIK